MKRFFQFAIFLAVFSSVYFLMNWFAFSQVSSLLGIERNGPYYGLLFGATFSFLAASVIESKMCNWFSKIVYIVAAVWMGTLTISFAVLPITWLLGLFFPWPTFIGWVVVIVILLLTVYSIFNALNFDIKTIEIENKKIKKKTRIIHLSDLHLGPIHKYRYLNKVVAAVEKANPDYVMITGDLIDGPGKLPDDLLKGLNKIKAPIFYSVGNHERYIGIESTKRLIANTKIKFLDNDVFETENLFIVGVEDAEDKKIVDKKLQLLKINRKKLVILLYHRPYGLEYAQGRGVDLMLSGHTHSGQIFPFNFLVRSRFPCMKGLFEYKGTRLYVTSGTGTWGPPMRLGSRNEIAVIDLVPN